MASAASAPVFKKTDSIIAVSHTPGDRHARIARTSLHNLIVFHEMLEDEMRSMASERAAQGSGFDSALFDKMAVVKEKYLHVMAGLSGDDYQRERHALIDFADAVQDLMAFVHKRRDH